MYLSHGRRMLATALVGATGFGFAAGGALAATPTPAPLQVATVNANAPSADMTVIEGIVMFNPNLLTLTYCLSDESTSVAKVCVTKDVSKALGGGASGTDLYDLRIDQATLGSVIDSSASKSTPVLKPFAFIARVTAATQEAGGFVTYPLSIKLDASNKYLPVIGSGF